MTGKPLDAITDEERTSAKCVNFGMMSTPPRNAARIVSLG
jgi:hypothetical protein